MTTKRARLIDVATAAGVSTATVSYVLSGARKGRTQPASPDTVQRIREVAAELGYVPNQYAQAIRRGHTNAILLAIGVPEDPWSAQVTADVQRRALGLGFSTLLLADETWYEFLQGSHPSVAFITSADFEPDGLRKVQDLADRGATLVVFSTRAEPEQFDVISSSAVEPTHDAYLRLRARHDRVHFLTTLAEDDPRPGPTRLVGFRSAAEELGDDIRGLVHPGGTSMVGVAAAAEAMLSGPDAPSAVICVTGYFAGVLRDVALARGMRIPDDLEIIGIGDIPHNELSHLGPISHYGSPGVFGRIGEIVVNRAVHQQDAPFERHVFEWEYSPGTTTRDAQ